MVEKEMVSLEILPEEKTCKTNLKASNKTKKELTLVGEIRPEEGEKENAEPNDGWDVDYERELDRKLSNSHYITTTTTTTTTTNLDKDLSKIKLSIRIPEKHDTKLRICPDDPLSKVIDKLTLDHGKKVKLFFDGRLLKGSETPNDLELEDGDLLDATLV
eukprot:TRINITY_DN6015_c0_g2_i2.p1 TRINITY_DN6015_c0_g2~~TRINITY_DN6015_c0_g2_i2.p1  ORF type:complete len:160 (-),score=56.11 TRINITY_DN6015_c0_g2_i2:250-729(-)